MSSWVSQQVAAGDIEWPYPPCPQDDSTDHLIWDGGDREIDWDTMLESHGAGSEQQGGGEGSAAGGSSAGGLEASTPPPAAAGRSAAGRGGAEGERAGAADKGGAGGVGRSGGEL